MIRMRSSILSLIAAGSTASVLLVGCCCNSWNEVGMRGQSCNDVPQGSLPDPCGLSVHRFWGIQKRNAEALSYIVFTNEWYMGEQTLGPYGEHHVQQLARLLPTAPLDVIVQPSLDAALNESRRQFVVARLLQAGVLDAERRVRVEYADGDRIYGEEAPRIFNNMLRSNQFGGQGNGAGSYFPGNVTGSAIGSGFGGIR
jgi:hypothetical protein